MTCRWDAEIVREGNVGIPTVIARAGSHAAASFDRIAQRVAGALGWRASRRFGEHDGNACAEAAYHPIV